MLATVFAGDRRVWRAAALVAAPFAVLIAFYCVRPNTYFVGTNSVEVASFVAPAPPGARLCVSGLLVPAGTARVRLWVVSQTRERPTLDLALRLGGRTIHSVLTPAHVSANRISSADFPIRQTPPRPAAQPASLCVTSAGHEIVNWGGTPLPAVPSPAPTLNGGSLPAQIAVYYLPRAGAQRSYLDELGQILERAALFRPGIVGAWTYVFILFLVLPAIALLAIRCLALAVAGRTRRLAAWLFVIAALNACSWALITPAFQGPDEVDHFAYTQSLVERGETPNPNPASPLPRWSSAEDIALNDIGFGTDHQVGDSKVPWLAAQQDEYYAQVKQLKPAENNDGGYSTSAVHAPLYYLALAPAYLLTSGGSIFSQLTLMRITSALIGALVVVFTFLLARELAPRRPWLAVLAAVFVAFEPMFGFVSGLVNNDVGVNACAAALEFLLIRMLRRGITVRSGLLTGVVLAALPMFKATGLSLYPVAGLVFIAALWRDHGREQLRAWGALALGAICVEEFSAQVLSLLQAPSSAAGTTVVSSNAGVIGAAFHNIPDYLSYLWQALLPPLGFMTPHFPPGPQPFFLIFVQRGWADFGWYDVIFPHWVYVLLHYGMAVAVGFAALAVLREWRWLRRNWLEALAVLAMAVAVIAGFEAAYYTPGFRPVIAEFGRYAFPAIGPLAVLTVGALHVFGRKRMLNVGVALAVAMIALSYASQLLTLTTFYA
jgi:4-amino-4-deoxy-L-arabinose transferase-like glycosyltransferase